MDRNRVEDLLSKYSRMLGMMGIGPCPYPRTTLCDGDNSTVRANCRAIIIATSRQLEEGHLKPENWAQTLGIVQGMMFASGVMTLEEIEQDNTAMSDAELAEFIRRNGRVPGEMPNYPATIVD